MVSLNKALLGPYFLGGGGGLGGVPLDCHDFKLDRFPWSGRIGLHFLKMTKLSYTPNLEDNLFAAPPSSPFDLDSLDFSLLIVKDL